MLNDRRLFKQLLCCTSLATLAVSGMMAKYAVAQGLTDTQYIFTNSPSPSSGNIGVSSAPAIIVNGTNINAAYGGASDTLSGTYGVLFDESAAANSTLTLNDLASVTGTDAPAAAIFGANNTLSLGAGTFATDATNGSVFHIAGEDASLYTNGTAVTLDGLKNQYGIKLDEVNASSVQLNNTSIISAVAGATGLYADGDGSLVADFDDFTGGWQLTHASTIQTPGGNVTNFDAATNPQLVALHGTSYLSGENSYLGSGLLLVNSTASNPLDTNIIGLPGSKMVLQQVLTYAHHNITDIDSLVTSDATLSAFNLNFDNTTSSFNKGIQYDAEGSLSIQGNSVISGNNASYPVFDLSQTTRNSTATHTVTSSTISAASSAATAIKMAPVGDEWTLDNATIIGGVKGGAGNDTVTIDGSTTIVGDLDFGAGTADDFAINADFMSNHTIANAENILFGSAATWDVQGPVIGSSTGTKISGSGTFQPNTGSSFTGDITLNDSKSLALVVKESYTTTGAATKINHLSIDANKVLTLTNPLTLGVSSTVGADAVLNVPQTVAVTGEPLVFDAGSSLKIGTDQKLDQTDATDAMFTVPGKVFVKLNPENTSAQQTVVEYSSSSTGSGSGALYDPDTGANISDRAAVTLSVISDGPKIIINQVDKPGTTLAGFSSETASVGTFLDGLNNPTGALAVMQSQVKRASTKEEAIAIMQQLYPALVRSGAIQEASRTHNNNVGTLIASHLSEILLASKESGVSSGDSGQYGAWGRFFGGQSEQSTVNGVSGYKAKTVGGLVGIDGYVNADMLLGFAFSYGRVDLDAKDNLSSQDINSYQGNLYGRYSMGQWLLDGMLGVGSNEYDTKRYQPAVPSFPLVRASFNGMQYLASLQAGYQFGEVGPISVIPSAGVRFTSLDVDSYTETGGGTANQTVTSDTTNALDLMAGLSASATTHLQGTKVQPEMHVRYMYDAIGDKMQATSSFAGQTGVFITNGVKPSRSTYNVGTKSTFEVDESTDVILGYDFIGKSNYREHVGMLEVRMTF